ncbi:MAG TPA: hypothetical protein VFC80_04070 [Sphaerochaeta sp.]|nr:hypothetical protein [Sphaerochaeta sp.]
MSKVLSYSEPVLFSALQKALGALVREDSEALSWPKPKPNIAHRLALHLDTACKDLPDYPATMQVDILTHQSDIIIHDRSGAVLLRILLSTTYLTQSQQAHLISFAEKEEANLVMGIAFLKETGYFLLYHPRREVMDYYHYRKHSGQVKLLRERSSSDEDGQLLLGIQKRRRRKPVTTDR